MTYQERPITTVGALIQNEQGRILLIKTHKWSHKYGIPGGKIEMGETAEAALIREIKEETGLSIYDIRFAAIIDSIFDKDFYRPRHFILLNYFCKTMQNDVILNEEAEEYLWINPELALEMDLNGPTQIIIKKYLANGN